MSLNLDIENTEIAFKSKSNFDLKMSKMLFKVFEFKTLVTKGPLLVNGALKLGLPIRGILKKTIFNQFCGGETIEECVDKTISGLAEYNVGSILDYSVEGLTTEEDYDKAFIELSKVIEESKSNPAIPFAVFKVTALANFSLLEKVHHKDALTADELEEFNRVKSRVKRLCAQAYEGDVRILIDAEESWIQAPVDSLAVEMMHEYNKEKAIVYNTIQMYRHDRLGFLKEQHHLAINDGYFLGLKIVRGAYMEKERARATAKGYPSPIQKNKEATDRDYDLALEYCLENINDISIIAGSHNEKSTLNLVRLMHERTVSADDERVEFAQLLGMSDNLSFNLAYHNYKVAKYVPYGPVEAVMPYLFRRADENTSIAG